MTPFFSGHPCKKTGALLLGVCALFLSVAQVSLSASGEPERTRWEYSAMIPSGTIYGAFTRGGHDVKVWVENVSNGASYHFVEVARNQDFIEIYDAARQLSVRLYSDRCTIRHSNTAGRFIPLYQGGWTVATSEPK
jgi:hypothetical protein